MADAVGYCRACDLAFCPPHLIDHDPRCRGRPDPKNEHVSRPGGLPCSVCSGILSPFGRPIEEVLNCLGYWGFGAGYLAGLGKQPAGEPMYCSLDCPLRAPCHAAHRDRARRMFPELAAALDRFVEKFGDTQEALFRFLRAQASAGVDDPIDPYHTLANGNWHDGVAVALLGRPKDRGEGMTVPWPFPPVQAPRGPVS